MTKNKLEEQVNEDRDVSSEQILVKDSTGTSSLAIKPEVVKVLFCRCKSWRKPDTQSPQGRLPEEPDRTSFRIPMSITQ